MNHRYVILSPCMNPVEITHFVSSSQNFTDKKSQYILLTLRNAGILFAGVAINTVVLITFRKFLTTVFEKLQRKRKFLSKLQ